MLLQPVPPQALGFEKYGLQGGLECTVRTEPVHSYCRGGDADFSSLSEAVACDSHVSSATP